MKNSMDGVFQSIPGGSFPPAQGGGERILPWKDSLEEDGNVDFSMKLSKTAGGSALISRADGEIQFEPPVRS